MCPRSVIQITFLWICTLTWWLLTFAQTTEYAYRIFCRAKFWWRPFWLYYSNYVWVKFSRNCKPFCKTKDWPGSSSCSLGTKYWSNAMITRGISYQSKNIVTLGVFAGRKVAFCCDGQGREVHDIHLWIYSWILRRFRRSLQLALPTVPKRRHKSLEMSWCHKRSKVDP